MPPLSNTLASMGINDKGMEKKSYKQSYSDG